MTHHLHTTQDMDAKGEKTTTTTYYDKPLLTFTHIHRKGLKNTQKNTYSDEALLTVNTYKEKVEAIFFFLVPKKKPPTCSILVFIKRYVKVHVSLAGQGASTPPAM